MAVRNLRLAQQAIAAMNLFHMHGLLEYYLFKAYCVLNDQTGMTDIIAATERRLGGMQGYATEILISCLRVLSPQCHASGTPQSDIERLEVAYLRQKQNADWMLLEALARLRVQGLSAALTTDDLALFLDRLRYTGAIPFQQLFLVFLAEMNLQDGNRADALSCLEEAAAIYKEHGISVHLHTYPLTCLALLKDVNAQLYKSVVAKGLVKEPARRPESRLSAKEKAILELMALGKNNTDISQVLYVSVGTVKWHINHIFAKLEARNRVEAVRNGKALGEIQ